MHAAALLALAASLPSFPQEPRPEAPAAEVQEGTVGPIEPVRWLVLDAVDERGRRPFRPDAVYLRHLLDTAAPPPRVAETLTGELGRERVWREHEGNKVRVAGRGGYAYARIAMKREGVWLAHLQGAATLFVNGAPFQGDIYRRGYGRVPVALRAGDNHVYVTGVRGSFELRLEAAREELFLAPWDVTLPDLVRGEDEPVFAGAMLIHASTRERGGVVVRSGGSAHFESVTQAVEYPLPPLYVTQVPVPIRPRATEALEEEVTRLPLTFGVADPAGTGSTAGEVELRLVSADEHRMRSYVSDVDGSVQHYALVPPGPEPVDREEMRLVLACHGAGVRARGMAGSYSPKNDFWIVAPTNRREFGFDWQDWGRRDAYDALERAFLESGANPRRIYVTGHSMGGHGAWHLAANDPDLFAAVGPSAGWRSFDTYGGRPDGALRELWHGADGASLTHELMGNLAQLPAYIVHGTADDNVPASEGRAMQEALEAAGGEVQAHYEEGAGHWWNGERSAGVDCVDWPPLFDLFRRHEVDDDPEEVSFTSAGVEVDAVHHWVRLEQPLEYGRPMRIEATSDREAGTLEVRTENVRCFSIRPTREGWVARRLTVDGQGLAGGREGTPTCLLRTGAGEWIQRLNAPRGNEKSATRTGPFKQAFDRRFVLVYGTLGDEREDAELLARARYDAQQWAYRGNGHAAIFSDLQFLARWADGDLRGRNVVLYGNVDTNGAWTTVLPEGCPVVAERGRLRLRGDAFEGDELAAVFVYPLAGDEEGLVAVFADTGARGTRLGNTLSPFVSGVGYPDYAVVSGEVLRSGDGGVVAAGWFDWRWR